MAFVSGGGRPDIIPRPRCSLRAFGCTAVDSKDFYVIASITVPSGRRLHLTKIVASADDDVMIKIAFGGQDITGVYYVSGSTVLTDWFPYGWNPLTGDGSKQVAVLAKASFTSANVCADICGELE